MQVQDPGNYYEFLFRKINVENWDLVYNIYLAQ